jgi:predicted alpha/beta hydrolase family esterase
VARRFLVLHGWQNRRWPEHWQWQLVEELRSAGEQVLYPQLPDPDRPSLAEWASVLHAELAQLGAGERVVVAHSLSVPLWLHVAGALSPNEQVDRVLLVSPPSPAVLARYPEIAEFAAVRYDPTAVQAGARSVRVVCGDDDPYCPEGVRSLVGDVDVDLVPGGRHLDLEAGYGGWPSVHDWCLDPGTRLVAR